jgi:hypothetical protein
MSRQYYDQSNIGYSVRLVTSIDGEGTSWGNPIVIGEGRMTSLSEVAGMPVVGYQDLGEMDATTLMYVFPGLVVADGFEDGDFTGWSSWTQ